MSAMAVLTRLRRFTRPRIEQPECRSEAIIAPSAQPASDPAAVALATFAKWPKPYKLHVACGGVKLDGWINVDRDPASEIIDVSWDIRHPLPISDCSCELIHNEHFLEHLTVQEALAFLRECRRMLIPGGVLRVAMPDLADCVRQYYENDWRQPWMTKYGYEWIQTRAEAINIEFRNWEHQWLYDREELHRRLREAGFENIRDCQRLQSAIPTLRGLETREESTLVCEAVK
jgi:predicted SAM-dependent methyltransferase